MITLNEIICAVTGFEPGIQDRTFTEGVIDSRQAAENTLFIAIPGEHTDGHQFISAAFAKGCTAALIQEDIDGDFPVIDLRDSRCMIPDNFVADHNKPVCIRVENTIGALQKIAAWHRTRLSDMEVLGITGSVGKTSTKELIYDVLSCRYRTLKTPGNMNNEIGLPLTLLKSGPDTEQAVLEMGFYVPGEIDQLCQIAQPSVGVLTNVGMVHASRAGSMEVIAQGKSELVKALKPDGTAILNFDDPYVRAMAEVTPAHVFFYGKSPEADLYAGNVKSFGMKGVKFDLFYQGEKHNAEISLTGAHSVYTALCAVSVALLKKMTWEEILSGLKNSRNPLRMRITKTKDNGDLIDDSYNSSPDAAIAALSLLSEMDGRKIAVLGDMLELGQYEKKGHEMVGKQAAAVCDALVAIGPCSKYLADAAIAGGMDPKNIFRFETAEEAVDFVSGNFGRDNETVLVKGSLGMRMRQIVQALEAEK